jgi:hypothetical protein
MITGQDTPQIARLAAAFVLVLVEPESPAVLSALLAAWEAAHEWKHRDQAFTINQLDEPRVVDRVAVGLQAAVQDHDHRDRRTGHEIVRHGDRILASARPGLVRHWQGSLDDGGGGCGICLPGLGQGDSRACE